MAFLAYGRIPLCICVFHTLSRQNYMSCSCGQRFITHQYRVLSHKPADSKLHLKKPLATMAACKLRSQSYARLTNKTLPGQCCKMTQHNRPHTPKFQALSMLHLASRHKLSKKMLSSFLFHLPPGVCVCFHSIFTPPGAQHPPDPARLISPVLLQQSASQSTYI